MTDYSKMADGDLLAAMGTDSTKWAAAFQQKILDKGIEVDEELMHVWFANAIMHTHDTLTGCGPVVLPDGSAFVVGQI